MNKTAIALGYELDPCKGPTCPYCGATSWLVPSSFIYGEGSPDYGKLWVCTNHPKCDSYVGTHKHGEWKGYPLGRLADAELREAKKRAHSVFDVIWRSGKMPRGKAYRWLQEIMEIKDIAEAHIGEMDVQQCNRLYEHCCNLLSNQPVALEEDPL